MVLVTSKAQFELSSGRVNTPGVNLLVHRQWLTIANVSAQPETHLSVTYTSDATQRIPQKLLTLS